MEEEDLIRRLKQLQIEENELIERLKEIRISNQAIKVGDTVRLRTRGVQSKPGDVAIVIKVTRSSVHVRVKGTGHHTRRSHKNVTVIKKTEDEQQRR